MSQEAVSKKKKKKVLNIAISHICKVKGALQWGSIPQSKEPEPKYYALQTLSVKLNWRSIDLRTGPTAHKL